MFQRCFALVLAALPAGSVLAQATLGDSPARTAREVRREGVDPAGMRARARAAAPKPTMTLSAGVAYDKDEADGKVVGMPLAFSYRTPGDKWWKVQVLGDYGRATAPGSPAAEGWSDITVNLLRPIAKGFTGSIGVGIPVGGDMGSKKWSQRAKLIHSGAIQGDWSYVVVGSLSHTQRNIPGVSDWSQSLYGEVDYDLGNDRTVLVGLARGHTRGRRGATELSFGYDFPIRESLSGTLSLNRGLTSGFRHTGVGFDLTYTF